MGGTALLLVSLLAGLHMSNGLSCPSDCTKINCPKISCSFGEGPGICNCCPRCLKGPKEACEGIWNLKGSCAQGLKCSFPPNNPYGNPGICVFNPLKHTYGG